MICYDTTQCEIIRLRSFDMMMSFSPMKHEVVFSARPETAATSERSRPTYEERLQALRLAIILERQAVIAITPDYFQDGALFAYRCGNGQWRPCVARGRQEKFIVASPV